MSTENLTNKSLSEIYKKISSVVPDVEWKFHAPIIDKINKLKKRETPISIILSNLNEIETYGYIPDKHKNLIYRILPGKYTILLEAKKHSLSKLIQNKSNLIGIRITKVGCN